ncbi:MAG: hypothetical protein LBL92_01760, partial [Propionibacteriaceae bacterium]|nr:hypothetical protein [Propionibacteriaceae bacterium]
MTLTTLHPATLDLRDLTVVSGSLGQGLDAGSIRVVEQAGVGPRVYKRFRDQTLKRIRWRYLDQLVEFGHHLAQSPDPLDQRLWASCAWPEAIVYDGADPVGVVQRFHGHADRPPLSGQQHWTWLAPCDHCGNRTPWVRLGMARVRAGAGSVYFPFPAKLARLGMLWLIVEDLHRHDLCVGDLKDGNVL